MKHLLALAVMACFSLGMMAQGNNHLRFVQNGEFGNVSQSTSLSGFNLQVSRGFSTTNGATATLQYSAFDIAPDFSSLSFVNAFGPIPPSAFTGQNTQNLALSIDTSTLPATFFSESCTLLLVPPFTFTCGAGPAGVISLQFRENDAQTIVIHALQQEVRNGPVTTLIHQRSDSSTANVQGSVFGTVVAPSAFATVGVNHQSTLEITHN